MSYAVGWLVVLAIFSSGFISGILFLWSFQSKLAPLKNFSLPTQSVITYNSIYDNFVSIDRYLLDRCLDKGGDYEPNVISTFPFYKLASCTVGKDVYYIKGNYWSTDIVSPDLNKTL